MVAIGAYLVPTALALLTGGVPLQEGTVAQLRGVTEVSGLVQGYVSAPSSITNKAPMLIDIPGHPCARRG